MGVVAVLVWVIDTCIWAKYLCTRSLNLGFYFSLSFLNRHFFGLELSQADKPIIVFISKRSPEC